MQDTIPTPGRPYLRSLGLLALGLIAGIGGSALLRNRHPAPPPGAAAAGPRQQMYQCPMHPQVMLDHPGDCPICGMTLVPMASQAPQDPGHGSDGHAEVTIDPERQQLIGLRTAQVSLGLVSGELRAAGRVAVDERRVRKVNVKVEGFVEKLYVDFLGKPVAKGAPLFSFYSPELVSAQGEYLLALKTQQALAAGSLHSSGSDLLEAARQRLTLWDVPREELERLERTGQARRALTLRSPIAGVVTAKNVVEGARLTPADIPFEITDLSAVWVLVDLYETEIGQAQVGLSAELSLQAYPGRAFKGKVAFVDPLMDPKTRTVKLRLEFANPKGELKPDLFGEVRLKGRGHQGILIPLDAVLDAGSSKVVFVALGNGKFQPRPVTAGATVGEQIEILAGLKPGEQVVVRAAFLVDSESRLKAALAQLSASLPAQPSAAPAGGHQH